VVRPGCFHVTLHLRSEDGPGAAEGQRSHRSAHGGEQAVDEGRQAVEFVALQSILGDLGEQCPLIQTHVVDDVDQAFI